MGTGRVGMEREVFLANLFRFVEKNGTFEKWRKIKFLYLALFFCAALSLGASVPSAFAEGPFISFDQTDIGIDESAGTLSVGFTVDGEPSCFGTYIWKVFTEDGSAVAGVDYGSTSQQFTLTLDPDSNVTLPFSDSIEIPIIDNCICGSDRSFSVVLEVVDTDAQCQLFIDNPAKVTIADTTSRFRHRLPPCRI